MLITFYTKVYPDVVMFGDVGLSMLRGMGLSGRVPGALHPEDIPAARAALEDFLRRQGAEPESAPADDNQDREDEDEDEEPPVPLGRRALPLLEMLDKAEAEGCDILWK